MRTLTEIYASAKQYRDQYLGMTNAQPSNSSKLSVMDAFTWAVSACIWTFDNLLDVFQSDIAQDISKRINGTPLYYVNALKKFQAGDQLVVNADGTGFSYPQINESKRIITRVSYHEYADNGFHDTRIAFKVAKGEPGDFSPLSTDELNMAKEYLRQISFAGMHLDLTSRKGDLLVPDIQVYYDGGISKDDLYQNIEDALEEYVSSVGFDGRVYIQQIEDAIQHVEHVVDTKIISIQVAQYNDDNQLGSLQTINERYFVPNGGYITQSSKTGAESSIANWKDAIYSRITVES